MKRVLSVEAERFPIAGTFTISRGSKTEAEVVTCVIREGSATGRGECVPYRRYGETIDSVRDEIGKARTAVEDGVGRSDLLGLMPAGAARNALDCALWDLEAKLAGMSVAARIGAPSPRPLVTAYTLSLASPDEMARQARAHAARPVLKIKVGGADDLACMRAVALSAPNSRIILDANEGWSDEDIAQKLSVAAELGIALIEQPLPAGKDSMLARIPYTVPICADESVHVAGDLDALQGLYDCINIKLDKAGGLTAALELRDRARAQGFSIMVGCMVGTSLAMAPAVLLAQDAEFVDLDGPLLLAQDRTPALAYEGSTVLPPSPALWG